MRMVGKIRVSMVQPACNLGAEEKNVERALEYIDLAKQSNPDIICFPEGYPGPFWDRFALKMVKKYSWIEEIKSGTRKAKTYVIAGGLEYIDDKNYYDVMYLIGRDGEEKGKYIRTTPANYRIFDEGFQVGDDLPVFETDFGKIGILTCSEVYTPELSRILALKGAEVIFIPAGGCGFIGELRTTWKALIWARAIENLAYTATCEHVLGAIEGICMVAGPEKILGEKKDEGILTVTVDLDRIRWLRKEDETLERPLSYLVPPGILKWRRPDLYRKNYPNW